MHRTALAWTLVVLLAGCGGPPSKEDVVPGIQDEAPVLHGLVVDEAIRPILGASVTIIGRNETATTIVTGEFAFPETLPREQVLIIVVSADGFQSTSRQTSLPPIGGTALTITMQAAPSDDGYRQVLHFTGFIGCEGSLAQGEGDSTSSDCGNAVKNNGVWEFTTDPRLLTAVVEVAWEAAQPMAEGLGGNLTKIDPAGDRLLSEVVGRSSLRLVIPQQTAAQLFVTGGEVRLQVFAQPITDEDEQAVAASLAVNQQFEAYASLFYGVAPDPTYSFIDET